MNTRTAYWLCQIVGWGTYAAGGFLISAVAVGLNPSIEIGFALFFLYSIAFTHMLRAVIRRYDWLSLPVGRGMPRIFVSAMLAGLIQGILVIGIGTALAGSGTFDTSAIFGITGGLAGADCMWAAVYVGIHWNRRYREAQLKEVQLELGLRQAELRALQAQINPHFLFNSLNTIRGMISENPQRAQEMITSLASLFRRSLQANGEQMVPLAEEMDAVQDYLSLEATRFEERLRVTLDVEEDARDCSVPAMLVQTLVENAVKHGIAKLPAGGVVRVSGVREHEALVLKVENSGRITAPDPNGTHTGLSNARDRLRLFYGERASLQLSGSDGMVTATVVIPQQA
jgi:two-component sensor histidine kinase